MPLPHDPGPHWGEVGIHGLHRHRVWDVVVTVDAPEIGGEESWFVVLERGRLVVEDGAAGIERLAEAVTLEPPFRAHAVRRDGGLWVVGALRIEHRHARRRSRWGHDRAELGRCRAVGAHRRPTDARRGRRARAPRAHHAAYVVTATRIDGTVWEVAVTPL